jgi:hypothetical protein
MARGEAGQPFGELEIACQFAELCAGLHHGGGTGELRREMRMFKLVPEAGIEPATKGL